MTGRPSARTHSSRRADHADVSGIRWRQRSGRRLAAGSAALALVALAGCGEDDQESIEESVDDAVTQVSDAATEASDVLSTVVDSIDDVTDTVADEVDDAVTEVSDAVDDMTDDSGSDTTALPDGPPPVNPCAAGESGDLGGEGPAPSADATEIEVIARDFAFDGLEAIDSTGEYALTLTNTGSELHEVVMVRIDDDETRPIEELLMEEDPSAFATDVAFAFACPGDSSAPVSVQIDEPGRYVAVCFIPVGTTPQTPPEDFETMGPPHAMEGMVAEIEVS